MKGRKSALIFLIVVISFTFSGCLHENLGLGGGDDSGPAGGVFRSTDGGVNFEQKTKISEEATFSNQDVLALVFDPANTSTLYAGTRQLGLVRSTNRGDDWEVSGMNTQNVRAIFADPDNPSSIHLIGSVEGVSKFLRSTDGGENWTEVFAERNKNEPLSAFAINEDDASVIYLGDGNGGIYKSTDSGETWKNILFADSGIKEIKIDSVNTSKVYFVTVQDGILRTDDGGENFEKLQTKKIILNFVVHPNKEGVVFVSDTEGLKKSTNSGQSFEMIDTLIRPENIASRSLAVNPKNDNILYFASGDSIYKTVNGGTTWKPNRLNIPRRIVLLKVDPANPDIIYFATQTPQNGGGFQLFPFLN